MIDKFKADRDPQGLNVVRLDSEITKENIVEHLLATPFLAEKRMVVLERLLSSKQIQAQEDILLRMKEGRIPQETVLLCWEDTGVGKTNVVKELFGLLKKEPYAQEFPLLTGAALERWIAEEIVARGVTADKGAVSFLATNSRGNLWQVSTLVDQAASYRAGSFQAPVMTQADVALFLEEKVDDNIFNLVDAIVAGQGKAAFAMMAEQYRQGKDAGYVFAMVLRQFRIFLDMRDAMDRDTTLTSDALAKALGIHPFVAKKSLPLLRRYTAADLRRIYEALLEIDIKTKTGRGDQSLLLDIFVGRLALSTASQ